MTGAWLLTNNLKQISDCTGGRKSDAVRYCQSEQDTGTKAMPKFLSSTAGASFNQELPTQTVCVRKDCVELVSKVDKGVYAITNLVSAGNGQMRIIANWGRFFDRVQNPVGYSDTINEAAINFILREFVMSKVSFDSMMSMDMVVDLLRPQLEVTKKNIEPVIIMGLYYHRDLIGSREAFTKVI